MRAGPLSNDRVIQLLNSYFAPVYVVNEDYRGNGIAPAEEKSEYQRIYREALAANLSTGTVHVYLVAADDLRPFDSLHVANAAQTPKLIAMLEAAIARFKLRPGPPLARPRPQSRPPLANGGVVLHLVARGFNKGSWREFPGENWIALSGDELAALLGSTPVSVGATWEIERSVATKILRHCYPQTENNDVSTNRIDELELKATVIGVAQGVVRARLAGRLRMKHAFYPNRDDDNFVHADLVGLLEYQGGSGHFVSLQLVTVSATYGNEKFGVALRSVP